MRARLAALVLTQVLCLVYAASPFVALWRLHTALDQGDAATLERRVEWRASSKTLRTA